jgi:small subunit ribosomal protein S1
MSNPSAPESHPVAETNESFEDILTQYEKSHSRKKEDGGKQLEGTVIAVSAESVFFDIGFKTEGIMPLTVFQNAGESVKPGDKISVSVKGRDPEGYYELSRQKIARPTDWSSLEQAFADKAIVVGTVTGVIKGGFSVDVGVRAFMPASRSGIRDAADMEKLVGQEVRCRIIKLDATEEDVVVDRRALAEEEERSTKERRYSEIREGEVVHGTVRSLTDYGAFIDLGGVDGLLHVGEIAWARIHKPADVLTVGQHIDAKVLKVDPEKKRISLGTKQLLKDPWDSVAAKYKLGERVRGTVTRVLEFGAFVELEPGIEGLIHVSEMSWAKKVRIASDVVKSGESVEVVVLGVNQAEHRISLGLKQALGDPWPNVAESFGPGTVIEGPITSLTKFGAFVQLGEGIEGMIHVSDISAEKRIEYPQDVLNVGQLVKAQVLSVDTTKRLLRLGMKQLVPTSLDEYIAEHKEGDVVTGRMGEVSAGQARVELGDGINATCRITAATPTREQSDSGAPVASKPDLSSLSSKLKAHWKGGATAVEPKPEAVRTGQIRKFRIVNLDPSAKKIDLELA